MRKRPLSITVIGWLFIAAGAIGFAYHIRDLQIRRPFKYELVLVCCLRLLAILGGVFVLRAKDWARWLLLAWIACHVVLSVFHSLSQVIVHGLLLAVVTYVLCRPQASAYFRGDRAAS
jgi:hypothetical protein